MNKNEQKELLNSLIIDEKDINNMDNFDKYYSREFNSHIRKAIELLDLIKDDTPIEVG